jgi:ligand-binding sensor domain-containing protein
MEIYGLEPIRGFTKYNIATNSISKNLTSGDYKVSCICIDKKGVVWIGTDGKGIWVVSPVTQQAVPYLSADGKPLINIVAVYSIYEDGEGP